MTREGTVNSKRSLAQRNGGAYVIGRGGGEIRITLGEERGEGRKGSDRSIDRPSTGIAA